MNFKKKIAYGLPALITAGAIFYVSSLEKIQLPLNRISFNDLLFHSLAYFFFGITLLFAAYPWHRDSYYPMKTCLILTSICILYGISDEIHQYFVPMRACTISDIVANSGGVTLSIFIGKRWITKKKVINNPVFDGPA